jgi:arginine utilization protein RocB
MLFFTELLAPEQLKTKEQLDNELKETIDEIKQEKKDQKKERKERFGLEKVSEMKHRFIFMVLHIVY